MIPPEPPRSRFVLEWNQRHSHVAPLVMIDEEKKKKRPMWRGRISRPSLRKGERINIYIYLFDVARCAALRKVQSARIAMPWRVASWISIFIYRALRAHRLVVYKYYIIPRHISKRYVGVKCARADIYNIYKTV